MCIAILSPAHSSYRLIIASNRDEFLNRPTARATWWPSPHDAILGGRDLLRQERGTWLAVSKTGKIAILTNFRDDTPPEGLVSRGAIINAYLKEDEDVSTEEWVSRFVESGMGRDAGGFSLVCGKLSEGRLAVVSNRARKGDDVPWIELDESLGGRGKAVALSNAAFTSREWPKVIDGERILAEEIVKSVRSAESEDALVERLMGVLSIDTLPKRDAGEGLETQINQLRKSIFIPALGRKDLSAMPAEDLAAARKTETAEVVKGKPNGLGSGSVYGTQKQTVILIGHDGRVRFRERTLFDDEGEPLLGDERDANFEFRIEP